MNRPASSHRARPGAVLAFMALIAMCVASLAAAAPLGSSFTYQGKLVKDAVPYAGPADFVFRLYDDAGAGTQVGADVSLAGVTVAEGLFTVELDFGAVFDGTAQWLEISVQTPGDADYTVLAPRQLLAATPYALHALSAPGGGGSQWNNDPSGIDYTGNVGIGTQAAPSVKLYVNGGTANVNPLVVANNNTNWGALAVRNDAPNGYGIYDAWSDRHYFDGFLGLGNAAPTHPLDVSTLSYGASGIMSRATGAHSPTEYQAAVIALGYNGTPGLNTPAMGMYASSESERAVWGISVNNLGVVGDCQASGNSGWLGGINEGVYGRATTSNRYGAIFENTAAGGVALRANGLAQVKTLQILGADLAESFPVREADLEPGTVLVIDEAGGGLCRSQAGYDRRVAGVVSGANGLDAGVVLKGASYDEAGHAAVALSGRVWVKCDATREPIRVGDALTTAGRPGHAMRASDAARASGAVLGKAMSALPHGTGLVLVLVNLR